MALKSPEHFDRIAGRYAELRPSYLPLLEKLAHVLQLKMGMKVLDVGCGPGHDLAVLRDRYGILPLGIDRSQSMIDLAAEALGPDGVACADAVAYLRSHRACFDAAFLKFVIHHFSDWAELFSTLCDALRPGAYVAVVTMLPDDVAKYPLIKYFPTLERVMRKVAGEHEKIESCLADSGFRAITVTASDVGELVFDQSLITQVQARYISFLNAVSDEELARGVQRLSSDINEEENRITKPMRGVIIYGQSDDTNR